MQDGQVIAERYAGGWGAARPHALASGTKSFTGIVATAALADGLIASLDERVADTITEWQADPRKSRITVRELLTLSSGLQPESDLLGRQGAGIRDLGGVSDMAGRLRGGERERMPPDRFEAVLGVPAVAEPGGQFAYGPTHFYAFGAFLERKLRASERPERTYWEYLSARVLAPAGIPVDLARFAPDQGDKPNLPGGGHLTAREWARFGEFVRCGGRAIERGEDGVLRATDVQAIPAERIAECFAPSAANPRYGLTWWLLNGAPGDAARPGSRGAVGRIGRGAMAEAAQLGTVHTKDGAPLQIVMAAGAGKQRLYIVPELGLVVVRFAELGPKGARFNDLAFLRALLGPLGAGADGSVPAPPPAEIP
jgi:CubicO group peptidase (beta-lactamase class C family)